MAGGTRLSGSDPLVVTRFVNLFFWLLTAWSGHRLARLRGGRAAGLLFVFLLATSPLILHYYSVPLPDTMAVALAMTGTMIWCAAPAGWRTLGTAAALLGVATLIKSPVTFSFLVFLFVMAAVDGLPRRRPDFWTGLRSLLVLTAILLGCALAAQQLRILWSGPAGLDGAENAARYFGPLAMRADPTFWAKLWQRLGQAGPLAFGWISVGLTMGAVAVDRRRSNVAIIAAGGAAFLSGWLVFANLNSIHDYYQIPGMVLLFLALAVSGSRLLEFVATRLPGPFRSQGPSAGMLVLAILAVALILTQDSLSVRTRTSLNDVMEYALRHAQEFLFVSDRVTDPAVGGQVNTRFMRVSPVFFEAECEEYLGRHRAVLVDGESECLERHRHLARYFLKDDGMTFYLGETLPAGGELRQEDATTPALSGDFQVFLNGRQLIYVRDHFQERNLQARFFLHVYPVREDDLAADNTRGFQNLDFDFRDHGSVVDGAAMAVRRLPDYPIRKIVTGQFRPDEGRIWQGTLDIQAPRPSSP